MTEKNNDPRDVGHGVDNPIVAALGVGFGTGIAAGVLFPFEVVGLSLLGQSFEEGYLFLDTWVVLAIMGVIVLIVDAMSHGLDRG